MVNPVVERMLTQPDRRSCSGVRAPPVVILLHRDRSVVYQRNETVGAEDADVELATFVCDGAMARWLMATLGRYSVDIPFFAGPGNALVGTGVVCHGGFIAESVKQRYFSVAPVTVVGKSGNEAGRAEDTSVVRPTFAFNGAMLFC